MVKLRDCLESLNKTQLMEIVRNHVDIPVRRGMKKAEIIDQLASNLPEPTRLERIMHLLNDKDFDVIKMFMKRRTVKYNGMSLEEFTKFIMLNRRMGINYADNINKLRTLGLLFMNVSVKKKEKVVMPSDFFKFFAKFIDIPDCS
ncbi:MAG: hypothetical protein ACTSWN_11720 [Promethearchaeota archaeon]